jgi:hypothetical protein
MTSESRVSLPEVTGTRPRLAFADNLKVVLVAGVIIGHTTPAGT